MSTFAFLVGLSVVGTVATTQNQPPPINNQPPPKNILVPPQNNLVPPKNNLVPPSFNLAGGTNFANNNRNRPGNNRIQERSGPSANAAFWDTPVGPVQFGPAPVRGLRFAPGFRPAPGYGLVRDGVRYGYFHWSAGWRDFHFTFGGYISDPFGPVAVVPSPWYYYPSLPPYIPGNIVTIGRPNYIDWIGDPYRWGNSRDVDIAVRDIVELFRTGNETLAEDLTPTRGRVEIYFDNQYAYSIGAEDFFEMFYDGVVSSRTRGYQIQTIWIGDRVARVLARHDMIDPWGRNQWAFHEYTLVRERGGYVIRGFGVSR